MNSVGLLAAFFPFVFAASNENKTAQASTQTLSPYALTFEDMLNMDVVDYLRSGALIVGFLATVWAGRETWLLADVVVTAAFGAAAFFFPNALLSYETVGNLDIVHTYLAQAVGMTLLGAATTSYLSLKSRDDGVHTSLLFSRFISAMVLLQAMAFDYLKAFDDNQRWSTQYISFGFLGCTLWMVGSLIHILKSPTFTTSSIDLKGRLSRHLLIDICLFFTGSLAYYAFPAIVLSPFQNVNAYGTAIKPDGIHAHLVRTVGALLFGSALHGFNSLGFHDKADQRAFLAGRVVMYALVYPTVALYQWKYQFVSSQMALLSMAFGALPAGNAACGCFIEGKLKRH